MTEAVAVFHDVQSLQAAVDELLMRGFDHAELSILANRNAILSKLGGRYTSTTEFEDDPNAPRIAYVPDESYGDAQGAIIAVAAYLPAVLGSILVASSGGTLLTAVTTAAFAGGAGASVGAVLAGLLGSEHAKHLRDHLDYGGVLLWVRTHDQTHERLALEVLQRHSGDHVHLHNIPPPMQLASGIPTRRPALSFGAAS